MKLIVAYIQPEKLNDVKQALYRARVFKISATNALGCGEEDRYHESYRGVDFEVSLLKKVRLEIAINDDYVDAVIEAVITGAKTGNIGDGKIFVLPMEQCIRIRTGDRGFEAIG